MKPLVVLAFFLGVCLCVTVHTRETVVIVSMDGMAWQILNASIAPNLAQVAEQGVKAKYIKTVTPSMTWPNHHSYMTGLFPESHGIVSNTFWDPVYKEMFIYEYDCSNFDPKFYNATEPLWLTLQNRGGRSGVYFWPGATGYTQNPTFYEKYWCPVNCGDIDSKDLPGMRNTTMDGYPPYVHCYANFSAHPFKSRVDKVMGWLKSDEPPNFVALYIDEPDWKGHDFGPYSTEYRQAVELVDKDVVGYFIESLNTAGLLEKVNLIFVSDHGFIPISSDRQIYLDDFLDRSAYRLSDSGALGHIWPHEGRLDEVYNNLTRIKHPHMTVYKKEDIPESFHWKNNRRIPPIFVNPEAGWIVKQSRPHNPTNWTAGYHGWPDEKEMYSVFFARGPAFRKGVEVPPFNTVDLYPLMARLLGVQPRPNNGSFENVKGIVRESTVSSGQKWSHSFMVLLLCFLITAFV